MPVFDPYPRFPTVQGGRTSEKAAVAKNSDSTLPLRELTKFGLTRWDVEWNDRRLINRENDNLSSPKQHIHVAAETLGLMMPLNGCGTQ